MELGRHSTTRVDKIIREDCVMCAEEQGIWQENVLQLEAQRTEGEEMRRLKEGRQEREDLALPEEEEEVEQHWGVAHRRIE